MRIVRSRRVVVAAATVAVAVVFTVGYAAAAGNQVQGNLRKEYVRSGAGVAVTTTSWTLLSDLTTFGTWQPGELLVARFSATSRCQGPGGLPGLCMVRVALDCLDLPVNAPEFLPAGAATDAFDSATGTPQDVSDAEAHATTRYLTLPAGTGGCGVIVEAAVSNDGLVNILNEPVLTIDVALPTAT